VTRMKIDVDEVGGEAMGLVESSTIYDVLASIRGMRGAEVHPYKDVRSKQPTQPIA
jgi:hypothetical protein